MIQKLLLTVEGKPEPRGSKVPQPLYDLVRDEFGEYVINPVTGKPKRIPRQDETDRVLMFVRDDNPRSAPWMRKIAKAARQQLGPLRLTGALELTLRFYLPRPQYHFGTGRNAGIVKDRFFDAEHIVRPDRLKLARAVEDALSDVLYVDDAQTVGGPVEKHYVAPGTSPRVEIELVPLAVQRAPRQAAEANA